MSDSIILLTTDGGATLTIGPYIGTIEYEPSIVYKVNKNSAFMPHITHKRGQYSQDIITCEIVLEPAEYFRLTSFITQAIKLYIRFDTESQAHFFKIHVEKMPKMTDSGRQNPEKYTFVFKSIYDMATAHLNPLNMGGFGSRFGTFHGWT